MTTVKKGTKSLRGPGGLLLTRQSGEKIKKGRGKKKKRQEKKEKKREKKKNPLACFKIVRS